MTLLRYWPTTDLLTLSSDISGETGWRTHDYDGAFIEFYILAAAGSPRTAPDTLGVARPRMGGLVCAAIRLGTIQDARGRIDVVDYRDMAGRSRLLAARVHPENDVVLFDIAKIPDEHIAGGGRLVLARRVQKPRTAHATRVDALANRQSVERVEIGDGKPSTVHTQVGVCPLLGRRLQLSEVVGVNANPEDVLEILGRCLPDLRPPKRSRPWGQSACGCRRIEAGDSRLLSRQFGTGVCSLSAESC
jgi:hypothetical protein